jgi:type VI secretion system protein ImpC
MSIFTVNDNETDVTLERDVAPLNEDAPFRLLLIGDWGGREVNADLSKRLPIEIDRDNFDETLQNLNVELALDLHGDGQALVKLRFAELDDFHPDKIYQQVSLFADLRETRQRLMNPQTFHQTAGKLRRFENEETNESLKNEDLNKDESQSSGNENQQADSSNLLDQILSQSDANPVRKHNSPQPQTDLDNLISRLVKPFLIEINETEQAKLVEAMDEATSELMRTILHHPQFQALESAWRAVYLLISRIETNSKLKIYLLQAQKEELAADLKSVNNLSESGFYKLLNDQSFSLSNDESWAVVCGNYTFEPGVDDTATLMRIAKIAKASETAFIAQACHRILGVESLAETMESDDWRLPEDSEKRKLWEMLRGLPEASFVGLTLPRFLGRMPYGAKSDPTETFSFEEVLTPDDNQNYLWTNSSFACALLLAQSFSLYEWELSENLVRDIDNLPLYIYKDASQTIAKPVTEVAFRVNTAEKIIEQGLMPLVSFRDTDRIRLARFQSIASPPTVLKGKWII